MRSTLAAILILVFLSHLDGAHAAGADLEVVLAADVSRSIDDAEFELQRNRDELAHMTRVATLGALTTSIAHELNQPLGAILSNAEAAEMFLMAEPPALDDAELAEIERVGQTGFIADAGSRVTAVEASYRTIEAALKAEIERLRP